MKQIKTLAFLMLIISVFIFNAEAKISGDSIIIIKMKERSVSITDTPFIPVIMANPAAYYQNLVYQRRLDSIQKNIPLDYNEHVQTYIDIFSGRAKEKISRMLGLSQYYFPIYEKIFREQNVPDELKFLSIIESELNPHAVSKSGATGLWQFMYTTAKGYGLKMDSWVDERKDPVASSTAAAVYLRESHDRFGDWLLAIASYNCGAGCVSRAIKKSGGKSSFWDIKYLLPLETQNYVPAFIATVYLMNYYDKHDIVPASTDLNIPTDILLVNQKISLDEIAKAANLDSKQLSVLNPSYKKKIINGSAELPKRLIIPVVNNEAYTSLYQVLNNETNAIPRAYATNYEVSQVEVKATHKVNRGENLLNIANQYNVEVQDLKVWNNLKQNLIVPGQLLQITGAEPSKLFSSDFMTYKVQLGDTLLKIAGKFKGVTVAGLKALNNLEKDKLKPGMLLKIVKG